MGAQTRTTEGVSPEFWRWLGTVEFRRTVLTIPAATGVASRRLRTRPRRRSWRGFPVPAKTETSVASGSAKTEAPVASGSAKTETSVASGSAKTEASVASGSAKTDAPVASGSAKTEAPVASGSANGATPYQPGAKRAQRATPQVGGWKKHKG